MKSLWIVAVAALASLWPSGNVGSFITLRATITVKATHQPVHSGSIVMEDAVILITDTGDPKEDIVNIKVFTLSETLVMNITGCGSPSCGDNLSSLSPGNYEVRVYTDESNTFSDIIAVGYPE